MNFVTVGLGFLLVGMGAFAAKYPMRIRSIVSSRGWSEDPEAAEQYQRLFPSSSARRSPDSGWPSSVSG